jgi:hypothetical protein
MQVETYTLEDIKDLPLAPELGIGLPEYRIEVERSEAKLRLKWLDGMGRAIKLHSFNWGSLRPGNCLVISKKRAWIEEAPDENAMAYLKAGQAPPPLEYVFKGYPLAEWARRATGDGSLAGATLMEDGAERPLGEEDSLICRPMAVRLADGHSRRLVPLW